MKHSWFRAVLSVYVVSVSSSPTFSWSANVKSAAVIVLLMLFRMINVRIVEKQLVKEVEPSEETSHASLSNPILPFTPT